MILMTVASLMLYACNVRRAVVNLRFLFSVAIRACVSSICGSDYDGILGL